MQIVGEIDTRKKNTSLVKRCLFLETLNISESLKRVVIFVNLNKIEITFKVNF
jgi:hypothetical protein